MILGTVMVETRCGIPFATSQGINTVSS